MPHIVFIEPNGTRRDVEAEVGETAMLVARRHGVEGILGECGGSCICATCHCYVDAESAKLLGPMTDIERDTLEFVAVRPREDSRLACQIILSDAHGGLVLQVVGDKTAA